jgi:hypothetical protein
MYILLAYFIAEGKHHRGTAPGQVMLLLTSMKTEDSKGVKSVGGTDIAAVVWINRWENDGGGEGPDIGDECCFFASRYFKYSSEAG